MSKRLSFPVVIAVALLAVFLIAGTGIWLKDKFNLPDWTSTIVFYLLFLSYFEIVGQFGPTQLDTPLTEFSKMAIRDKVVIFFACLAFIIITLPIGMSFDSRWAGLFFTGIGVLVSLAICFLFGSDKLKASLRLKRKNDKIV